VTGLKKAGLTRLLLRLLLVETLAEPTKNRVCPVFCGGAAAGL
jgi:hypothetical protein